MLAHSIKSDDDTDMIDENYEYDEHESIVDSSIEIVEYVPGPNSKDELTCDDFESLIYTQITSQLSKMYDISIKNNEAERKMNFVVNSVVCSMTVNKILGDGACFFRATEHQLNKSKLNTRKNTNEAQNLRKEVVEYIKKHRKQFDNELKGSVYDWYERMGKPTKNVRNISKICDNFLQKELPKTNFWAGSESLKAVTLSRSVNILILNENGDCYFSNRFNENWARTIILAHCTYSDGDQTATVDEATKRDHYSSVVNIEPNSVFLLSKHLASLRKPPPAAAKEI